MERKPLPEEIIQVLDIKRGMKILDFGCGRGRYTLPLARIVGSEGRIYALDREKGELEKLRDEIQRWKLDNIETIHGNGEFILPEESIDLILSGDVLCYTENKPQLFRECHRVLKKDGILSIFTHTHFSGDEEVINMITESNLFTLKDEYQGICIYNFQKKTE